MGYYRSVTVNLDNGGRACLQLPCFMKSMSGNAYFEILSSTEALMIANGICSSVSASHACTDTVQISDDEFDAVLKSLLVSYARSFNVGDVIAITDIGNIYPNYEDMYTAMGLTSPVITLSPDIDRKEVADVLLQQFVDNKTAFVITAIDTCPRSGKILYGISNASGVQFVVNKDSIAIIL